MANVTTKMATDPMFIGKSSNVLPEINSPNPERSDFFGGGSPDDHDIASTSLIHFEETQHPGFVAGISEKSLGRPLSYSISGPCLDRTRKTRIFHKLGVYCIPPCQTHPGNASHKINREYPHCLNMSNIFQ